jgi:hypothetical protein
MRIPAIAAALLSLSLAACSGSDPAPAPIPRSGIVLFTNAAYVNYTSAVSPGTGYEARNMEETLAYLPWSETVTLFTGLTAASIDSALAGQAVFVMPELEVGNLNSALDTAARNSIASFVAAGGTLVVNYPGSYATQLLNGVFGFATVGTSINTSASLNTTAAATTPFAGGASSIPYLSATNCITAASLPSGSVSMYTDLSGNAAVAVIPYGAGDIVVLGWDWFNAWPLGAADSGWIDVFYSALLM